MTIQGARRILCCSAFSNNCLVLYGNMSSVKIHYALMKCAELNQFVT